MKIVLILCSLFFCLSVSAQTSTDKFLDAANVKFDEGDYAGAMSYCTKSLILNSKNSKAYVLRAHAKFSMGDYAAAIKDYTKGAEFDPENWKIYYNRGNAKALMGNAAGAISDYSAVLKIDATSIDAYLARGYQKEALGNYPDAVADYKKALTIDPEKLSAYNSLGAINEKIGKLDDAIGYYNQALDIDSKSAISYYNRGVAYLKYKKDKRACSDFQMAKDLGLKEAEAVLDKNCKAYEKSAPKEEVAAPVVTRDKNAPSPADNDARQMGWAVTSMDKVFATETWKENALNMERAYLKIEVVMEKMNRIRALDPLYDCSAWIASLDKCRTIYFAKAAYPKPDLFDFRKYTSVVAGKVSPFNYQGAAKTSLKEARKGLSLLEKINQTETKELTRYGVKMLNQLNEVDYLIKQALDAEPNFDLTSLTKELEFYKAQWEQFKTYKKDASERLDGIKLAGLRKLYQQVKDEGMTNELHDKYVKKIVFSTSEIDKESPSESSLITSFKLKDDLYFRAFFTKSIGNEYRERFLASDCKENAFKFMEHRFLGEVDGEAEYSLIHKRQGEYFMRVSINDQAIDSDIYAIGEDEFDAIDLLTTEGGKLMRGRSRMDSKYYSIMSGLKAGTHQLRVELWAMPSGGGEELAIKMAQGELSFTCSENDLTNYRRTEGVIVPRGFAKDETLKAKMIDNFKADYPSYSFLRLEVMDKDWTINREFTGIILNRTRRAVVVYKKNGMCVRAYIEYIQEHDGNNYQKTMKMKRGGVYHESKIDCRDVDY